MHGHDHHSGGVLPGALVGVRRSRLKVNRIACLQRALLISVTKFQFAAKHIKKFEAGMHMRLGLLGPGQGNELGKLWVQMTVGDHVAQALEKVGWRLNPSLRKPHPVLLAVYPEH